jgi:hypothetical protein
VASPQERTSVVQDERADRGGAPLVDPDASPFELPPIEGLPYEKGSDEDRAVRRVIEEADRERAAVAPDA